MDADLLLDGEVVQSGDEFLGFGGMEWFLLPPWTWNRPLDLAMWGCVRRKPDAGH